MKEVYMRFEVSDKMYFTRGIFDFFKIFKEEVSHRKELFDKIFVEQILRDKEARTHYVTGVAGLEIILDELKECNLTKEDYEYYKSCLHRETIGDMHIRNNEFYFYNAAGSFQKICETLFPLQEKKGFQHAAMPKPIEKANAEQKQISTSVKDITKSPLLAELITTTFKLELAVQQFPDLKSFLFEEVVKKRLNAPALRADFLVGYHALKSIVTAFPEPEYKAFIYQTVLLNPAVVEQNIGQEPAARAKRTLFAEFNQSVPPSQTFKLPKQDATSNLATKSTINDQELTFS